MLDEPQGLINFMKLTRGKRIALELLGPALIS